MTTKIVEKSISLAELRELAKEFYATMIKGVVDIEQEIVAFGGEYHMDANTILIEHGSSQRNIWGFNIELKQPKDSWIKYTSLINIRPQDGNTVMEVLDDGIRAKMKSLINAKIV